MSDQAYHDQQQTEADAGRRVAEFIADPAVRGAITALEAKALAEFKRAETDDARRMAQAYSRVVDDFAQLLRGVVDRGVLAERDVSARKQRETQERQDRTKR